MVVNVCGRSLVSGCDDGILASIHRSSSSHSLLLVSRTVRADCISQYHIVLISIEIHHNFNRRMFHFASSSHCVLFRNAVKVSDFPSMSDHNVTVRSKLCVVN